VGEWKRVLAGLRLLEGQVGALRGELAAVGAAVDKLSDGDGAAFLQEFERGLGRAPVRTPERVALVGRVQAALGRGDDPVALREAAARERADGFPGFADMLERHADQIEANR
jgi:hypothetical protein